ncbi:MAG: YlbF family regulator [Verrucomicrobiales bacterium]|jgi:cell fate (sporulation/competence/biofilm development) regulator YlbF (YheA/YmcA/DUF963 family)|nr:YlbF family regulator [Verrucomicrobiales bacterium]
MIQAAIDEDAIFEKTRELCALILAQPKLKSWPQDMQAFMEDKNSQEQYRSVSARGRELHDRQMNGGALSEEEIGSFEKSRYELLENPVARAFIEAQGDLNKVQDLVNRVLSKSFELARVPEKDDLCCGDGDCDGDGGCGCH